MTEKFTPYILLYLSSIVNKKLNDKKNGTVIFAVNRLMYK